MAKLIYGMMQSLDGFIAGVEGGPQLPPPGDELHRYWNEQMHRSAGVIYGRKMYEVMSYWDQNNPEASDVEKDFAAAWQSKPKWVASRTLKDVGPKATLISDDLHAAVRRIKSEVQGDIDVAGPELAAELTDADLIDEYRLFFHEVVLGKGKPYFHRPVQGLKFVSAQTLPECVMLTYRRATP